MRKYGGGVSTAGTTQFVRPHDLSADDPERNLGRSTIFSGATSIGDIRRGSRMFVSRRIMSWEPAKCGFS